MGNRQMEDLQEQKFEAAVAEALGISADDLARVRWSHDTDESDDGLVYGYIINFEENSDQVVLNKISGLIDNRWIKIGPIDIGDDDEV